MCLTSNDDAERQHQTDGERRDMLLRSSEPDLPGMLKIAVFRFGSHHDFCSFEAIIRVPSRAMQLPEKSSSFTSAFEAEYAEIGRKRRC
jgi:hypothetical protein